MTFFTGINDMKHNPLAGKTIPHDKLMAFAAMSLYWHKSESSEHNFSEGDFVNWSAQEGMWYIARLRENFALLYIQMGKDDFYELAQVSELTPYVIGEDSEEEPEKETDVAKAGRWIGNHIKRGKRCSR